MGFGSHDAIQLGYDATLGLVYPHWGTEQALLYRKTDYPAVVAHAEWRLVGVVNLNGTTPVTIKNSTGVTHSASTGYHYVVARTDGNGYLSEESEPIAIGFDSLFAVIDDLPNPVIGLRAYANGSGEFTVEWSYEKWGQGGPPASFNVYGSTLPAFMWASSIGSVTYNDATDVFEFNTSVSATDGQTFFFGVQAVGVAGEREQTRFITDGIVAEVTVPTDATVKQIAQAG